MASAAAPSGPTRRAPPPRRPRRAAGPRVLTRARANAQWAERLLEGGGNEQWGDKWRESFKDGAGEKTARGRPRSRPSLRARGAARQQRARAQGEWWTVDAGGERYQRWWGEDHFGNGWVRKHGRSTTGEQWDVSEQMDTYYKCAVPPTPTRLPAGPGAPAPTHRAPRSPYPHFGYTLALKHSPQLRNVPTLPRGGDDLGDGISSL